MKIEELSLLPLDVLEQVSDKAFKLYGKLADVKLGNGDPLGSVIRPKDERVYYDLITRRFKKSLKRADREVRRRLKSERKNQIDAHVINASDPPAKDVVVSTSEIAQK